MSGFISAIRNLWNTGQPSAQPQAPAAPAAAAAVAEPQPYYRDSKGWLCSAIDKLSERQCEVISTEFGRNSNIECYKALAKAAVGVVSVIGVLVLAVAVAKLTAPLFIVFLAKAGFVSSIGEVGIFAIKAALHGVSYLTAGLIIWKIWNEVQSSVENHWNYSTHLGDLATKAALRKATFDKPVAPVAAPAPAPAAPAPVAPAATGTS